MKDKIVLIQNVATLRGTTVQDFEGMNELKEKFPDLEILAFPCNQFGHQCNEGADEIKNMLKYVRPGNGFEFKGKLFKKVYVNGSKADPLFKFSLVAGLTKHASSYGHLSVGTILPGISKSSWSIKAGKLFTAFRGTFQPRILRHTFKL